MAGQRRGHRLGDGVWGRVGAQGCLLVQVRLGLLTLDGGVQAIHVLFSTKSLCVLNGMMSLQIDEKCDFSPDDEHERSSRAHRPSCTQGQGPHEHAPPLQALSAARGPVHSCPEGPAIPTGVPSVKPMEQSPWGFAFNAGHLGVSAMVPAISQGAHSERPPLLSV